jgi:hypothetical protein
MNRDYQQAAQESKSRDLERVLLHSEGEILQSPVCRMPAGGLAKKHNKTQKPVTIP